MGATGLSAMGRSGRSDMSVGAPTADERDVSGSTCVALAGDVEIDRIERGKHVAICAFRKLHPIHVMRQNHRIIDLRSCTRSEYSSRSRVN